VDARTVAGIMLLGSAGGSDTAIARGGGKTQRASRRTREGTETMRPHSHFEAWRLAAALLAALPLACGPTPSGRSASDSAAAGPPALQPVVVTERVVHDTDDPAIWVNPRDPARSLVIGTDKNADGGLYAFDLDGRIVTRVLGLERPNNVDVEYGLTLGGTPVDVAVATERLARAIRVFRLPDLAPLDGGGIAVFEGEQERAPMGIALYRRPADGAVFAIVGRKTGPTAGYLWQYRLEDDGQGRVRATRVRAFGAWCGRGEIEAIAVDDALGYVYYSDEAVGIRKYRADPDAPGAEEELALFGETGFREDREGISIYAIEDGTGYILVSDQQANQFQVFPREGAGGDPHSHPHLKTVRVAAEGSDGSDVTSARLGTRFPDGLFVAMSEGAVFHYYPWPDLARPDLVVAPGGVRPKGGQRP
jgi:3-phytase